MYDELVKRLRNEAETERYLLPHSDNGTAVLLDEAADAIDGLSKSRWIPVTERLPKKEWEIYWICTDSGYQCECRWTNNMYGLGESDRWGWHIMDKPQYQKVIAWRKLPEPYEPQKEG